MLAREDAQQGGLVKFDEVAKMSVGGHRDTATSETASAAFADTAIHNLLKREFFFSSSSGIILPRQVLREADVAPTGRLEFSVFSRLKGNLASAGGESVCKGR